MVDNRLFQTLFILLEKKRTTAPELAEHFEVSVRTIYRDIDTLSAAGVPIYTTQGKGGGIFIDESYVLKNSFISEQEQQKIMQALQSINHVYDADSDALLSKLGTLFQQEPANWIEIDFSDWNPKNENIFYALRKSIFTNKVIKFVYHSRKGEDTLRTVEPLKLVMKNRGWYLYAYCEARQDYRLFKLNRIENLKITEEAFSRVAPKKVLSDIEPNTDEIVRLKLQFNQKSAYKVFDCFDDVEETESGQYLVHVSLPHNNDLYSFLLSFGEQIEVLAPREIRDRMHNKIINMKNKYIT